MVREIGEELSLTSSTEAMVAGNPQAMLDFSAWSESAGALTSYQMAVFEVELSGDTALATVAGNADNRWVAESEIVAGECVDGTRISPTMAPDHEDPGRERRKLAEIHSDLGEFSWSVPIAGRDKLGRLIRSSLSMHVDSPKSTAYPVAARFCPEGFEVPSDDQSAQRALLA